MNYIHHTKYLSFIKSVSTLIQTDMHTLSDCHDALETLEEEVKEAARRAVQAERLRLIAFIQRSD